MVNEVIYDLQVFNIEGPSTCYVNVKGQVLPRIGDTYRIGEDRNRKPYVVTDVIHRTNILEDRVFPSKYIPYAELLAIVICKIQEKILFVHFLHLRTKSYSFGRSLGGISLFVLSSIYKHITLSSRLLFLYSILSFLSFSTLFIFVNRALPFFNCCFFQFSI